MGEGENIRGHDGHQRGTVMWHSWAMIRAVRGIYKIKAFFKHFFTSL